MRKAAEIKPRDVSKGLLMDLAFLLIAALVLLVQEPEKRKKVVPAFIDLRPTSVMGVQEKDIPGESLFLEVLADGSIKEVLYNDQRKNVALEQIPQRIDQMPSQGERVVVFFFDRETPYSKVSAALDEVIKIQQAGKITKIYEIVRND